jgi:hypothetical protein
LLNSKVSHRDAFGRLLTDPARLSYADRVDIARNLAGELLADGGHDRKWLGRSLMRWLADGGDLAVELGLRTCKGSHRTPQAIVRGEEQRHLLRRLAAELGDRRAGRVLRGEEECPPRLHDEVQRARDLDCPTSPDAFTRARRHAR